MGLGLIFYTTLFELAKKKHPLFYYLVGSKNMPLYHHVVGSVDLSVLADVRDRFLLVGQLERPQDVPLEHHIVYGVDPIFAVHVAEYSDGGTGVGVWIGIGFRCGHCHKEFSTCVPVFYCNGL